MCLHLFLYIFRLGGVFLSTSTRCLGRQLPDKRDSPVAESSVKMQDQEEVHVPERSPVLSTATSSPVFGSLSCLITYKASKVRHWRHMTHEVYRLEHITWCL